MYHPTWSDDYLHRRKIMDYNNQNNDQNGEQTSGQGQTQYQSQNLDQFRNQSQDQSVYQGQGQSVYQSQGQSVYQGQTQSVYQGSYQSQNASGPRYNDQYSNPYSNPNANYNFGPQQPRYSSQNGAYSGQNMDPYQPGGPFTSPYAQGPEKPGPNACQIISLILGILSLLCCCTGLVGIAIAVVGLILAIIGNRNNKNGVGTGGLVCSIIGLVLAGIMLLLSLWGVSVIPDSMMDVYNWMNM